MEEILPDECRPSKRPRLIPEVLLYTWSAISKRHRKEGYEKIKALKNVRERHQVLFNPKLRNFSD